MLKQEQEFKAWGLSRLAVRNIVVFFLIIETIAIVALSKVIVEQQNRNDRVHQELIQTKERAAEKIEQLKNEQIQTIHEMQRVIDRQIELERNISAINRRVQKLR